MKRFGLPAISVSTYSALESTGDKRLLLQSVLLDTASALLLNCGAKTICKSSAVPSYTLLLSMAAKTLVITVGVPSLVLSLVASAKTLSKASTTISLVAPPDPALLLVCSAKTLIKTSFVFRLRSIGERINNSAIRLITEPYYAMLVSQ